MATFEVLVRRITEPVIDHPNADRLTIVTIDGFQCIANKYDDGSWRYTQGDLVIYVPEQAVVPEWILKKFGYWNANSDKGYLSGSKGNRVKAIKLRGIVSQGILLPIDIDHSNLELEDGTFGYVTEGQDVAELLGITKYEPLIPNHFQGQMGALYGKTINYDIENIQKRTNLFEIGEPVVVTEKLHGTNFQLGIFINSDIENLYKIGPYSFYVTSKGLGAKGFFLKINEANANNTYVSQFNELLENNFDLKLGKVCEDSSYFTSLQIIGEILGPGIQDLSYGLKKPELRIFDIIWDGNYVTTGFMLKLCHTLGLNAVPVLYEGPYDPEKILPLRDGKDTISGTHIREGIVIKSLYENKHPKYGRKIAKWLSPDYLLRKDPNATEFN